jgi:hypothetical protein
MRLADERTMDEIRWAFNSANWTRNRDDAGLWMAFSSTSESHNTMDKKNMESWLIDRGLKAEEVERLLPDVEKMLKRRSLFHVCANLAIGTAPAKLDGSHV